MKYGYYDDDAREYVITTPKTPRPWINYLGNEGFFGLISNTAGGYCFYRDARLRRITRYRYNNVPMDTGGRMYYIKDKDSVWSPAFLPCKTPLDRYRCRHGLGYTVFEGAKDQISASLCCFVPIGYDCEVNRLTLRNESSAARTLELFGVVEWCLWDAVDDSTNFQRNLNIGEVEIDECAIYHKTEYRERRDHYSFYGANITCGGFDTDRDAFLGSMGDWSMPLAVERGECAGSVAMGGHPIAARHFELRLAPGEENSVVFLTGYVQLPDKKKWERPGVINKAPAKELLTRFAGCAAVEAALKELGEYWTGLLGRLQIKSSEQRLDRTVNIWNQYQCMVTFNMSRSASYFESGIGRGMGFRDSCQDILGFVHLAPQRARQRILDIASVQLADGGAWHQYQPLTKLGNSNAGSGFNDDPLWLVVCTAAYLKETGDFKILEEAVPFDGGVEANTPLLEHLRRAVAYICGRLGPHGLPLIGRADWNDCLNLNCFSKEPGESFQTCANFESGVAESVFIAALYVKAAGEYAEILKRVGRGEQGEEVSASVYRMASAVLTHGWDGEWFLRAYDAYGKPVGSGMCDEGQIYIEPQGFCAIAGIGLHNGYARKALDSVKERLTTKYGTCLLDPCYTSYRLELGEISSYPPGMKENGSVFCHTNPWIGIGEALTGNPEEAYAVFSRVCPAFLEDISEIHETEPYVYCQTIAGKESPRFGQGKNSWLTGTAAWFFVFVSQYILGIRPGFDGLELTPCLPAEIKGYTATRKYRGCIYDIAVRNEQNGGYKLTLDGKPFNGKALPCEAGRTYKVVLTV